MNTLHVTNGDSVLYAWKKGGLLGTQVAWRDVLHEGPVLADRSLEELSSLRTQFLAANGYGNAIKIGRDFEKRDALLRRAGEFDEVVLWFEHDLYDQLQLLQILHVVREMRLESGLLEIIATDTYLGSMAPEELLALYPRRRSVTSAMEESGEAAWRAFTANEPTALLEASQRRHAGLPHLQPALERLCEEFPAHDSGLSRTERQIVSAVGGGARTKSEIFKRAQSREEAEFLTDSTVFTTIDRLSAGPAPLLDAHGDTYEITVLGRRVLAGDADWLDFTPLGRWIGGTHLTGTRHWRWNEQNRTFEERSA